jgi:hypothetical protein
MRAKFDRPTPWIIGSVKYEIERTGDPSARVFIVDQTDKSGSTPVVTLAPQITGGNRPMRRFEKAFQALGLLSDGEALVPAKDRTDILDQYGNVKSSLLVQLLAIGGGDRQPHQIPSMRISVGLPQFAGVVPLVCVSVTVTSRVAQLTCVAPEATSAVPS